MIDQRFMQSLADDMKDPMLGEETAPDTMLAAGPVTSDVPQTGVRLGRAGVTPQQSAKAGGLDRPAMALLDTLAGALQGATSQVIGLPGDIRSIIDAINQEGAEKYLGKRVMPTTEEVQAALPSVVPQGVANQAEREFTAKTASDIGTFLPAPGIPEAVVKGGKMIGRAVQATKNMPVGMSTQMVGEGVSDLGFYSAAKQAVDSIQQPKGTGDQFLKQIEKTPGVKPEEIKWTGLDDFLKSKKSVTKAEVQEFLDKNRVEIKEVRLGEQETYDPARLKQLEEEYANLKQHPIDDPSFGEAKYDEMIRLMNIRDKSTTDSLYAQVEASQRTAQRMQQLGLRDEAEKYFRQAELFNTRAEKLDLEGLGMEAPTKFSKYTLPGGENYREILITLPNTDTTKQAQEFSLEMYKKYGTPMFRDKLTSDELAKFDELNKQPFKSQHFDQPNILAHMRVNDRIDKDGKKVLFIEEVQSDWHQAGRKKGYNTPEARAEGQKKLDALDAEREQLRTEQARLEELAKPFTDQGKDAPADILDQWSMVSNRLNNLQREYAPIANQLATGTGVPDAPFKTTWHELAMKRAIQLAAEGGYDRVAFTTGKTQAERYDLSKQVKGLIYKKNDDGTYKVSAIMPDGPTRPLGWDIQADKLDEFVGKDVAKKIIASEGGDVNLGGPGSASQPKDMWKGLSGIDLKIGGEGMKGFYDQILPKFLDKYAKKWDAKTGQMNMFVSPRDGSVPINYIDVTPKMKESVLTKGQPLFAIGAGGAAVQQEENQ